MAQAKVVFTKLPAGRYAVHAHRPDGAVVAMPSSDRKFRVPHDLAHFVVESELKLRDGVFGSVMSGGLFQKMRIVAGPTQARQSGARSGPGTSEQRIAGADLGGGLGWRGSSRSGERGEDRPLPAGARAVGHPPGKPLPVQRIGY